VKRAVPRSKISGSGSAATAKPAASTSAAKPAPAASTVASKATPVKTPTSGASSSNSSGGSSNAKTTVTPSKAAPAQSPSTPSSATSTRKPVPTASYAAALKAGSGSGPSPGSSGVASSAASVGSGQAGRGGTMTSPHQTHSEIDTSSSPKQNHPLPLSSGQPALLQHQEQFPLPAGPIAANSIAPSSRHRAHSESYLNASHHKLNSSHLPQQTPVAPQMPLQQQPQINFMSGGNGQPNQTTQQQQSQGPFFNGFSSPFQYQGQQQHDNSFGMLSGGHNGHGDIQWKSEQTFRADMERSTSLGGLGWMPSSIATSPPESRRGISDLGVHHMSFGINGGEGRNTGYGNMHGNVPSPAAWANMVDIGVQNQYEQQPQRAIERSGSDLSRNSGYGTGGSGDHYEYSPSQSNGGLGRNEDDGYVLSDLRLTASEFVPSSSLSSWGQNGNGGSR
jgi:hypothetical protein